LNDDSSFARRRLIRDAAIYTPIFLVVLAAWGVALASVIAVEGGGGIFFLVLLALVAMLVGYQSIQSLRDLWSTPVTTEGEIARMWRRAELLLFPAYYIYVKRRVFRVSPLVYHQVGRGDMVVVTHYPHTSTVIAVERLGRGAIDSGE
jgi:hypothetical protein